MPSIYTDRARTIADALDQAPIAYEKIDQDGGASRFMIVRLVHRPLDTFPFVTGFCADTEQIVALLDRWADESIRPGFAQGPRGQIAFDLEQPDPTCEYLHVRASGLQRLATTVTASNVGRGTLHGMTQDIESYLA